MIDVIKALWSKDTVKIVSTLSIEIGRIFLGKATEGIWNRINSGVIRAESTGKSGWEKFDLVYDEVKAEVKNPKLYSWLLTILINAAVGILRREYNKLEVN